MKHRKLSSGLLAVVIALVVAAPAAAYSYPPVIRAAFIHGCLTNGVPYSNCKCLFNYIAARESFRQFASQAERYANGGPLPGVERRGFGACGMQAL